MADASSTSDPEVPELELGVYGAIRLKVAPRITLQADSATVTLDAVRSGMDFKVAGKGTNLVVGQNIPCVLEWLWLEERQRAGGEAPVVKRHTRDTFVVPAKDGLGFTVMEGPKDSPKPLAFDAIEMAVLGNGKLGYIVTLDIIGKPEQQCIISSNGGLAHADGQCKRHHLVVSPDNSTIEVALPIPIKVESPETSSIGAMVEVSWSAWTKHAAPISGSLLDSMRNLMSSVDEPQASIGSWAESCKLIFECAEYSETIENGVRKLQRQPNTEMAFEISNPDVSGGALFRLGTSNVMEKGADGPWAPTSFRYQNGSAVPHDHHFGWRIVVSRKPSQTAVGFPAQTGKRRVPPSEPEASTEVILFATAAHPRLESFEIGSDGWQDDLWVSCTVSGFDREVDLMARVDLWAHVAEPSRARLPDRVPPALARNPLESLGPTAIPSSELAPAEKVCPITNVLPSEFSEDQFTTVVQFAPATFRANHHFTSHVLSMTRSHQGTSLRGTLTSNHPGIRLFAALSFDPPPFGAPTSVVFMRVAQYSPNTRQHENAGGHAPFANGVFVHEVAASSICTPQIDLNGSIAALAGTGGIGVEQLRAIMPNLPEVKAREYVPLINVAMGEAGITTPLRQAAFLAQVAHESTQLTDFEERANGSAYEGRPDLGNVQPGDGVRFKGRSPLQLTGRANYKAAGEHLKIDLLGQPTRAAEPIFAFRIAAWFWNTRGLNELADQNQFTEISRKINGGDNGKAERESYFAKTKQVLGV